MYCPRSELTRLEARDTSPLCPVSPAHWQFRFSVVQFIFAFFTPARISILTETEGWRYSSLWEERGRGGGADSNRSIFVLLVNHDNKIVLRSYAVLVTRTFEWALGGVVGSLLLYLKVYFSFVSIPFLSLSLSLSMSFALFIFSRIRLAFFDFCFWLTFSRADN